MQCQVSSPICLLYVLSCPDMLWLTGDFLYWCLVVCSSFVCTTVVSTTCVCTVQSLLMCTKLHCTTELVIFSAAVVCGGGWWAAESVAMAMQCIVPDQMSDDSEWFKCGWVQLYHFVGFLVMLWARMTPWQYSGYLTLLHRKSNITSCDRSDKQ